MVLAWGIPGHAWAAGASQEAAGATATAGDDERQGVLRIALAAAVTSLDPHFHDYTPNLTVAAHLFDTLVANDPDMRLKPSLAASWSALPEGGWEVRLRPGVRFADGTPLTAADVVATVERIRTQASASGGFATNLKAITRLEVVEPLVVRLYTDGPAPTLMHDLATVFILPARLRDAGREVFDSGAALIGTGPFRPRAGQPAAGGPLVLEANPQSWHDPSPWSRIELWQEPDDARRVAGLLSGAFDIIERVPPPDAARLAGNPALRLVSGPSARVLFLVPDVAPQPTPDARAPDGGPLAVNPLADRRVRQAMSLAIDRPALVAQVLMGLGQPASQTVPPGLEGAATLPAIPYDLPAARALMAQAGWADGFAITLRGPENRYVADVQILRAVALMLGRIGVRASVETLPPADYFPRANSRAFSLFLVGLASDSGEASYSLRTLLGSRPGWGEINRGRWQNPAFDALLAEAGRLTDPARRAAVLAQAGTLAAEDVAVIPLHVQEAVWGMRRDVTMAPRADEHTLAADVRPIRP